MGRLVGALPRPDLPPGPRRDLDDALHALHHRIGWPSLRTLARRAGCSHTTVSHVFSSARLPRWAVLERLVEAMDGEAALFRDLWLRASSTDFDGGSTPVPRIAGRVDELDAVRRHLTFGHGLLLVTGEAGIGKSSLCTAAVDQTVSEVTVLTGRCLPLSTEVGFLPFTDVLRASLEADEGRWLKEALADCPDFVRASLGPLLPELEQAGDEQAGSACPPGGPETGDSWSRQRLLASIAAVLRALSALRPLALLLEDLHWADSSTLDQLDYLLSHQGCPPLVATFRLDDATVPRGTTSWLTRIRRLPEVHTMELAALSRDETAEQLRLLGTTPPAPELVERIYRRSRGQPLFTEQLAAHDDGSTLPPLLSDLLDDRLAAVDQSSWPVMRTLAVASRPLTFAQLRAASGLISDALVAALHQLDDQRLLAALDQDTVELRHPLLAEAVHRQLVPDEAAHVHRMLAEVLARTPSSAAADVAEHWQGAGEHAGELRWRIRAAREAERCFAGRQAAAHWLRVLQLWPPDAATVDRPPLRHIDAYFATMDALEASAQLEQAHVVASDAMALAPALDDRDLGELFRRSADYVADIDGEAALALVDRSIHLLGRTADAEALLGALRLRAAVLGELGRVGDALAAARRAAELSERVGKPALRRVSLMSVAWHEAVTGSLDAAVADAAAAAAIEAPGDPLLEISIGMRHTDILLRCGAGADDVEAAGRRGLDAAESCDIENGESVTLRANVAEAMRRAGRVREAARLVDSWTSGPLSPHRWALHLERAELDVLRGRLREAQERLAAVEALDQPSLWARAELAHHFAHSDLWLGEPRRALDRLLPVIDEAARASATTAMGSLLVLAARAAADLADQPGPTGLHLLRPELHDTLRAARAGAGTDPLSSPAQEALSWCWAAELSRVEGTPEPRAWLRAAAEWDRHTRPHEAGYCRWRAAQAVQALGQPAPAVRLLRRAEKEARGHLPLVTAIRRTARPAGLGGGYAETS